jgi:hypothetical protein
LVQVCKEVLMEVATRNQLRLIILVLLAFFPAILLFGYARSSLRTHEVQKHEQELLQIAQVTAVEYQRLLEESRHLLGALGEFTEIRDAERPECEHRLASVLRHNPEYTTLSLIGMDGYLACGSLTVDGGLYLGDRAYYRLATVNNQFSVGDYAIGRITGKPTVGVAYPIAAADGAEADMVLAASLDLSALGTSAQAMSLPEGTTFSVVDRGGNVLVRVPAGKHPLGYDTVGASAPEGFIESPSRPSSPYMTTATDLDGVDRLFAVAPLQGSGDLVAGFIAVGREQATLMAAVDSVARRELQFLAIALLGVLILAWAFGHYALVRTVTVSKE